MASTEDKAQKAQMSFGKILNTLSSAAPDCREEKRRNRQVEEFEENYFLARSVKKRGLLDIDLNVAPPEEGGDCEPPLEGNGGDGQEIRPTAAAFVSEEEEDKSMENMNTVTGSERTPKNTHWNALLGAAENALRDYEESARDNKEVKAGGRKRRPSRESEIGSELHKGTARKKMNNGRSSVERWNEAAEYVAAPLLLVRSTRGRAVAMPNKYRDSVLQAAAEMEVAQARLSRHNATRKYR
ncbi:hypothetical protein OROGR_020045 [Orobanche gracilis]